MFLRKIKSGDIFPCGVEVNEKLAKVDPLHATFKSFCEDKFTENWNL